MLHDRLGDRTTFLTISGIVLCAVVYGVFVIKKDNEQVDGDPFIRDSEQPLPSLAQDEARLAADDEDM